MPEPNDPVDPNQDNPPEPQDPPADPVDPDNPPEPQKPFTPDQEQFMGSWMGRMIAKQFDEKVVPLLQEHQATRQADPNVPTGDALSQFNERLTTELFEDPVGAIQKVIKLTKDTDANLSQAKKTQTNKALTTYSDDPFYKDIYQDMLVIAHEQASKGAPRASPESN